MTARVTATAEIAGPMPLRSADVHRHIELFAGAGGLAIGCKQAGFPAAQFYEIDKHSCATLRHNIESKTPTLAGEVHEGGVENVEWDKTPGPVRLLAGGAPCQPFSLGGRHLAWKDGRNLFPEVFRAMRHLRPDALLLENVRGLQRPDFRPYLEYVLCQAADPCIAPASVEETWQEHLVRIRRHQGARNYTPEYHVFWGVFNAADFGVPQCRYRVFIVATRANLPRYIPPEATHSQAALVRAQRTRCYWEQRGLRKPRQLPGGSGQLELEGDGKLPWVTVRDALDSLPQPAACSREAEMNHWTIPGARSYSGHSGSVLDWPSKAIKAGVHGVPGGENSLIDERGKFRYYTLREAARVQTFPDQHLFSGARIHVTRQIGNAVPCELARAIARPLYQLLESNTPQTAAPRRASRS